MLICLYSPPSCPMFPERLFFLRKFTPSDRKSVVRPEVLTFISPPSQNLISKVAPTSIVASFTVITNRYVPCLVLVPTYLCPISSCPRPFLGCLSVHHAVRACPFSRSALVGYSSVLRDPLLILARNVLAGFSGQ